MKISTKGRYALVIMINLARNYKDGKYISLKEISEKENISLKYLEKIMIQLNKDDYLDVLRGNNGGYRLKKEPKYYQVGDILRRVEGSLSPIPCIEQDTCDKRESCDTHEFWEGLYDEINKYVDSKTLQDYI